MNWDSKFRTLRNDLRPALMRSVDQSLAGFRDAITSGTSGSHVAAGTFRAGGILAASPPLHEYCSNYESRIDANDVDDIQHDFLAAGRQATILADCGIGWPLIRIGRKKIPISLEEEGVLGPGYSDLHDLPVRVQAYVDQLRMTGADVLWVDPASALHAFSQLAAPFLAARLAWFGESPDIELRENVEVTNNENGWNIVYRPTLLFGRQIGLGGPGSPVKGYIRPGSYVFGIVKGGPLPQWDSTSWNIPRRRKIHVPLPQVPGP